MSFRLRRPTGTGESSNSKPTRCSRIAQPIRRPSARERSLERSSSMDRINNAAYLQVSAAKRSRSHSATPMRTPTRPIPYAGGAIVTTGGKERAPLDDKKYIQSQAARINEYLYTIEHALGKDFFQRGGLKTMSTKQFVVIFEHLLKFIVGNRLKIGTNYVEDIVKVLAQIEYPFTINKSWLKTPNAPHAFSNVVVLLGWMLQFVVAPDVIAEFENELLLPAENMPNSEYALKFVVAAKEGFYHWNNSNIGEFDSLKKDLSDDFIKRAGMESLDFLDSEIKRFAAAVQKLGRNQKRKEEWKEKCSKLDRECADLKHKMHLNQRQLARLEKSRAENCQNITQLEEMIESKQKQIVERQARIETIDNIVRTQQMSIKDRDELISRVHSLKQLLDSKMNSAFELQDIDASHQVAYSRLIKQKIEKVTDFNKCLYKLFADREGMADVNVQDLCLNQNSNISVEDQIEKVVPFLENLKSICQRQVKDATQQVSELENQLKISVCEHDTLLAQKLTAIEQRCQELAAKIDELDMKIINRTGHRNEEVELLNGRLRKLIMLNVSLRDELSAKEIEVERLKNENEKMLAKVEDKCEGILQAKRARVKTLREVVDSVHNTLEELTLLLKDIPD